MNMTHFCDPLHLYGAKELVDVDAYVFIALQHQALNEPMCRLIVSKTSHL